jgi:hypothetical protein
MNLIRIVSVPFLAAAFALTGCGTSAPPADTAPMAPLAGTWSNATCFGTASTPSTDTSCTVALTFTSSLDVSLTATWLSMPATATYPGCTTTKEVTGQRWSTQAGENDEILTVTGVGAATMERTGCVNMTDDLMATPVTDISIESGQTDYQLSNGTLTVLSGDLAGTYEG